MTDKKVKLSGTKLEVDAGSTATARELKSALESDLYAVEGKGLAGAVVRMGDALKNVTRAFGRGTFEGIAWVLMAVGIVIAFVSWSRLLPLHNVGATAEQPAGLDLTWFIGIVGAAIVVGIKVAAARQAERLNERDQAQRQENEALMERKQSQANFWGNIVWLGLAADAVAAFAFAAAITQDVETGRLDYDIMISQLERDAKSIEYEAEAMPRPHDDMEILRQDLMRELRAPAYNNAGQSTPLSRALVTGWGVSDDGQPLGEPNEETYCLPGGQYASYVDRYCEGLMDLHRAVKQKQAWLNKRAEADGKRAEADRLRAERPDAASGMAVGEMLGGFGIIWRYIPSVFLMAVVLLVMVYSSFVAKRDLEGD